MDYGTRSRQPQRGQQKADEGLEKSQGVERKGPKRGMYEIERGGEEPKGVGSSLTGPSCCIMGAWGARLLCCAISLEASGGAGEGFQRWA